MVLLAVAAGLSSRALFASIDHRADVPVTPQMVARGAYLVRAADCVSCHTVPGGIAFAGGRVFDLGSMGRLYSPNITPDKDTGIGAWSDDEFRSAMHAGMAPGGVHLYPVFPYTSYTLMSDEDVLAIKAYLFSLKPVHALAPPNAMRFPFNYRFLLGFWNLLYNPNRRMSADSAQSASWNRGRYLIEALGHCGECHTPRNLLQARKSSEAYAGAPAQGWYAYNITSDAHTGIGAWKDEDLTNYLSHGHASGHGSASGPMAEVVDNSLRYLSAQDLASMVTYLRTVKAIATPQQRLHGSGTALAQGDLDYGSSLYAGMCANCHRADGSGAQTPYQSLQGAAALQDPTGTNLVQVVLHGSLLATPEGPMRMPAFAGAYSDDELAAVIDYAAHQLGHDELNLSKEDIARRR